MCSELCISSCGRKDLLGSLFHSLIQGESLIHVHLCMLNWNWRWNQIWISVLNFWSGVLLLLLLEHLELWPLLIPLLLRCLIHPRVLRVIFKVKLISLDISCLRTKESLLKSMIKSLLVSIVFIKLVLSGEVKSSQINTFKILIQIVFKIVNLSGFENLRVLVRLLNSFKRFLIRPNRSPNLRLAIQPSNTLSNCHQSFLSYQI